MKTMKNLIGLCIASILCLSMQGKEAFDAQECYNNFVGYLWGYGMERDVDKALEYNRQLIDNDYLFSNYYQDWVTRSKSVNNELERLQTLVERGDTTAIHRLGYAYESGLIDGQPDVTKAFELYKRAAEAGHPRSQAMLSSLYSSFENFGDEDFSKTREWCDKAVAGGDPFGMYIKGMLYLEGVVYTKDNAKGIEWLERAAAMGQSNALYNLGQSYMWGFYGVTDREKGISYLKRASDAGHIKASRVLAYYHKDGKFVKRDISSADRYFKKALVDGDIDAMESLGDLYLFDVRDYDEALHWYGQSYLYEPRSILNERLKYVGMARNADNEISRLEKIALKGDAMACDTLRLYYSLGLGVDKNEDEAIKWGEKAFHYDKEIYACPLIEMLLRQSPDKRDYKHILDICAASDSSVMYCYGDDCGGIIETIELEKNYDKIKAMAENGDAESMVLMGRMYEAGIGVEENVLWAIEWYIAAANAGSVDACYILSGRYGLDDGSVEPDERKSKYWGDRAEMLENAKKI